nr:MFS transporter [Bifidobacterium longum]
MVAGQPIGTMIGSRMINNAQAGFIIGAVIMLASGFVALAIWPREASSKDMERTKMTLKDLAVSFRFPKFSTSRDLYKAFGCRVCMLLSYQIISVYQLYIIEDYVHQTKTEAAGPIATMSIITMVVSLTASLISGPISDKMHTRKVPVIIASLLFAIGTAMPWTMPSVTGMYLNAGIAGFSYGVLGHRPGTQCRRVAEQGRGRQGPRHPQPGHHARPSSRSHHHLRGQDHDRHLHTGVRHLHHHDRVCYRVRATYPEGEVAAASAYLRFEGLILTLRNTYLHFEGLMPK